MLSDPSFRSSFVFSINSLKVMKQAAYTSCQNCTMLEKVVQVSVTFFLRKMRKMS